MDKICEHNKELWLTLFSATALAEHYSAPMTVAICCIEVVTTTAFLPATKSIIPILHKRL